MTRKYVSCFVILAGLGLSSCDSSGVSASNLSASHAGTNPVEMGSGEYPGPTPSATGTAGQYPGSGTTGGTGSYTGSNSITITPNPVCGPTVTPASQATLKNTTNLVAVLYQGTATVGNFSAGTITEVQAWDDPATTAGLYAEVSAMKPFQLALNQSLSPGIYTVVLYDASRVSAPYQYSKNSANAVAPIMDSDAEETDFTSFFTVGNNGNISMPSSYNVLIGLGIPNEGACAGAGSIDPLTINLGSSPIALSSQANGVLMDLDGNGNLNQISWPLLPAQVTFLVNLSNGMPSGGAIGPQQIFGNYTVGPDGQVAANGYDALAKYDLNGDGVINSQDAIWSELRVWQDLNRNGVADAGELLTLSQVGITSIVLPRASGNVVKENCQLDQYGNQICQGRGASVNLNVNGQDVKKQLVDIGFKPSN
jgi:hypothetical protein